MDRCVYAIISKKWYNKVMQLINVKGSKVNLKRTIAELITSVFTIAFLLLGTTLVILYAKGYRFNLSETTVEKTGVVSIDSNPSRANLYIDGELIGKTPKSAGSIKEGNRKIELILDGYNKWEKYVPVQIEKSTPYYAYLFLSKPISKQIFSSKSPIIEYDTFSSKDSLIVASIEEDYLRIYKYPINQPFWNRSPKETVVLEESITKPTKYSLLPSPDGQSIILTKISAENSSVSFTESETINPLSTRIILNPLTSETTPVPFSLKGFSSQEYSYSWTPSSNHLIIVSEREIYSYNVDKEVYVLLQKTDQEIVSPYYVSQSELFYYYDSQTDTIYKKHIDGSGNELVVTFSDIKEIKNFYIPENFLGILIETADKVYWYDGETSTKTDIVFDDKFEFLSFSPDGNNFLYKTADKIVTYTYYKKENDHVTPIGTREIQIGDNCTNFSWASSSNHLTFTCEEEEQFFYSCIIDIDGDNFYILDTKDQKGTSILSSDLKFLYSTNTTSTSMLEINQIQLR